VFHIAIWGVWSFVLGAKPTKALPWRRDCYSSKKKRAKTNSLISIPHSIFNFCNGHCEESIA